MVNKSQRWGGGVGGISNSPRSASLPDAKVEFSEVANGVLLIPPIGSFLFGAEPAFEPVVYFLQESVVCLREAEPMVVIHGVEFVLRQDPAQCPYCHSICESLRDPGDRKVFPSSPPG